MALFRKSARHAEAPARPVAQVLVREVHTTLMHLLAYIGVFAVLGFGAIEFVNGPYLDRAAGKILAATAYSPPPDWIAAAKTPKLRGAD